MESIQALQSTPGHIVRRVNQLSNALFAVECGRFEITAVQYAALVAIAAQPGVDATRLSELIAFDRSTIGDVLERLAAKGWVVRQPSPVDRRVKQLELSAQGEDLLEAVGPAVDRVQRRLLARLDGRQQATLLTLLGKIIDTAADNHAHEITLQEASHE